MKKRMTVLCAALAATLLAPLGARATGVIPPKVHDQVHDIKGIAKQARDQGASFAAKKGAEAQLAAVAEAGGYTTSAPAPQAISFADAMQSFYRAAGVTPRQVVAPAHAVATAVAPLIAAVAEATRLTNHALSKLKPGEREWAIAHLGSFEQPLAPQSSKLAEIAGRVNTAEMAQAAVIVAAAADHVPTNTTLASSWVDITGSIEIGSTGADSYSSDRVLLIDLGGNDSYGNSAGAIGAIIGNPLGLPVSINIDLGGDDYYGAGSPNQPNNTVVAQGAGLGGVGLLIDRWGNDNYQAYLTGNYPTSPCAPDIVFSGGPGRFPQEIYAQGAAGLGVGALIDGSGNDYTAAYSYVNTVTQCHFVRNYVHAQAAGMQNGIAALIDDIGNDYRTLQSYSTGYDPSAQDAVAAVYGQGFAAGGVGILVDKEGDDYNYANSAAYWNDEGYHKGSFALTFVQGSVAGVTHTAGAAPNAVGVAPIIGVPALPCLPGGKRGGSGGPGSGGPSAGIPAVFTSSGPCSPFGVASHIDLLGSDVFYADSFTSNGTGFRCGVGSNAIVGAQGSASWGGLATLVNLDVEGYDQFVMHADANGGPCLTSGISAGQGFGGRLQYPVWDDPDSYYASVDAYTVFASSPAFYTWLQARIAAPPIGVLVSAGPACVPAVPRTTSIKNVDYVPCDKAFDGPTASPDSYSSDANSNNPSGVAISESWAQGSGGRPKGVLTATTLPLPAAPPAISGVGVLGDVGGDDAFTSNVNANGPAATAHSVAQGATEGGIGGLLNVLGDDVYQTYVNAPGGTTIDRHQGQAAAGFGESITPIAAFADAGGNDTYGPTITCQANGTLTGPVIWGNLGTCGASPNTLTIGIDIASGIGL